MNRHRQPSLVFPVGYEVQGLNELPENHAHQIVQAFVRIRDAAEQGHFLFSHFFQAEFVSVGQPGDLGEIKGRQADAHADQDGFQGFPGSHLENTVLPDGDAFRVPHFQAGEQDVQRRFILVIFFPYLRSFQHFHDHSEVLFFLGSFVHEVKHEGLQKRRFRFVQKGRRFGLRAG